MKRIGILSDTHAHWDERYKKYFAECDEIWHAGDIGSEEVIYPVQLPNNVSLMKIYEKNTKKIDAAGRSG